MVKYGSRYIGFFCKEKGLNKLDSINFYKKRFELKKYIYIYK